jgi:hypothetical protein
MSNAVLIYELLSQTIERPPYRIPLTDAPWSHRTIGVARSASANGERRARESTSELSRWKPIGISIDRR